LITEIDPSHCALEIINKKLKYELVDRIYSGDYYYSIKIHQNKRKEIVERIGNDQNLLILISIHYVLACRDRRRVTSSMNKHKQVNFEKLLWKMLVTLDVELPIKQNSTFGNSVYTRMQNQNKGNAFLLKLHPVEFRTN
jgi:hypothetical protein